MPSKYKARPRDAQGARQGTIAAKVNKAMADGKWRTVDEIARLAGVRRSSVHRRLQHGRIKGVYAYEREIRFKLKRKVKK